MHALMLAYKENENKKIFCFVEGNSDRSYYKCKAEEIFPPDKGWEINSWYVKDKRNTLTLRDLLLKKPFYSHNRVLFFVDQDFSRYIEEETEDRLLTCDNLYITTYHSLENFFVAEKVLLEVLDKNTNMLDQQGKDIACQIFKSQMNFFYDIIKIVSAHIITWHRTGQTPHYENFKIKDLFDINYDLISLKINKNQLEQTLYTMFSITQNSNIDCIFSQILAKIEEENPKCYTRGKYELKIFIMICDNLYYYIDDISATGKKTKNKLNISEESILMHYAQHAEFPEDLRTFFSRHRDTLVGKEDS